MASLESIVAYCEERLHHAEVPDFEGASNGLQVANGGEVTRLGFAVDAGLDPFRRAVAEGVDLLFVHHGLGWSPPFPLTGVNLDKVQAALQGGLAVFGSHLPLDGHPEIGNNVLLARAVGLEVIGGFLPYQDYSVGLLCRGPARASIRSRLEELFPGGVVSVECGPEEPARIGVLTGSGAGALEALASEGIDTFITGEVKQHFFNIFQGNGWNLYACGHYRTETFGVRALAEEVGAKFGLPVFPILYDCPL